MIPFLDLCAHHAPVRDGLCRAMSRVLDSGQFAGGPVVEDFEKHFAQFCGTQHAVGVGSGTEALWLALLACGIQPGDEVILPPNTFIATAEAVLWCGARPVFADVDERTCLLDPAAVEAAITSRTRALIPVHLFGSTAPMDELQEIAARHGLQVIEDACQAHGAEYRGRRAGSLGRAGCFSFYPGKNLGALGEAGAVVTDDPEVAERIRCLRDHGQSAKYHHQHLGWNGRMDALQAAILLIKLRRLSACNQLRRSHARCYLRQLQSIDNVRPVDCPADCLPVHHLFPICTARREALLKALRRRRIGHGIHYPVPLHLQPALESLGHRAGEFPVAERLAGQLLSLPMYPELNQSQIEEVCGVISAVCAHRRAA